MYYNTIFTMADMLQLEAADHKGASAAEMLKRPTSLWTSPGDINGLHPWGSATRCNKMVAPSSQLKAALPMDIFLQFSPFQMVKLTYGLPPHIHNLFILGAHLTVSSICCNNTSCWSLPNVLSLNDTGSPLSQNQYLKQWILAHDQEHYPAASGLFCGTTILLSPPC